MKRLAALAALVLAGAFAWRSLGRLAAQLEQTERDVMRRPRPTFPDPRDVDDHDAATSSRGHDPSHINHHT